MTEFFIGLISLIKSFLGDGALIILSVGTLILLFITYFVLWLIKGNIEKKNVFTFCLFSIAILLAQTTFAILISEQTLLLFSLSVAMALLSALLTLPKRIKKANKSPLEFARELDGKYREQNVKDMPNLTAKKSVVESITPDVKIQTEKREVDFTHVKDVIKKLERFNLSTTDLRQVRALESAIYNAENGALDFKTKESVNEGLGALLKIMSKYGV